jgi:uncharacterized protein YciI
MDQAPQPRYYVACAETAFNSWAEVQQKAPQAVAQHIARSKQLHEAGTLLMAGAFLDRPDEPVTTMAVLVSREAAEEYMRGDPFVLNGQVKRWYIREWANMFYVPPAQPTAVG